MFFIFSRYSFLKINRQKALTIPRNHGNIGFTEGHNRLRYLQNGTELSGKEEQL